MCHKVIAVPNSEDYFLHYHHLFGSNPVTYQILLATWIDWKTKV